MSPIAEQTHEVSAETLMAFLDEELSASERGAVERHLSECRACQQALDAQKVLRWTLDSWTVPNVPGRVEERVLAKGMGGVPERTGERLRWLRKPWLVAVISSAATVAVLAVLVSGSREKMTSGSVAPYIAASREEAAPVPAAKMLANQQLVENYLRSEQTLREEIARRNEAAVSENLERSSDEQAADDSTSAPSPVRQVEPLIARTASLLVAVKRFPDARAALDNILAKHHGYAAELTVSTEQNAPRSLHASLRIPAKELAAALVELKALGEVHTESQGGEEVTQQHADLVARLKNARQTEQRLVNILQQRTGKIGDVLDVEREIARVRGDVEQMEADQQGLEHRVQFATVDLKLNEEYRAALGSPSPSVATRLRNAAVEGLRNVSSTVLAIALFFMEAGPSVLFWLAILILPLRFVWKRRRQWFASHA